MADMTSGNTVPDRYVVVIGGMNMDICGRPTSTVVDRDSNPGVVSMSAGGVGQNIAQNMAHLGMPTYLITVYGDDENGKTLERSCAANNINLDYAAQLEGRRSSTYMFITDDTGDLLVAVNDMEICKEITIRHSSNLASTSSTVPPSACLTPILNRKPWHGLANTSPRHCSETPFPQSKRTVSTRSSTR